MNKYIDHTSLKIDTGIQQLCAEAEEYKFRGICIFPNRVTEARKVFDGKISTVINFPYGSNLNSLYEARLARDNGADELDVVMNLTAFRRKKYKLVLIDLVNIVNVGLPVKVIVEEHYLSPDKLEIVYQIVKDSGAFCIKTSTGVVSGATLKTVALWKSFGDLKIKAAGGIRTPLQIEQFINEGVDIIGTSNGVQIIMKRKEFEDSKVNIMTKVKKQI